MSNPQRRAILPFFAALTMGEPADAQATCQFTDVRYETVGSRAHIPGMNAMTRLTVELIFETAPTDRGRNIEGWVTIFYQSTGLYGEPMRSTAIELLMVRAPEGERVTIYPLTVNAVGGKPRVYDIRYQGLRCQFDS